MMKKYLLGCAWLLATLVLALDVQSLDAQPLDVAEAEIIQVLKNQFDRPVTPLEVPIVVVSGDFAVADWVQDNRGGRALLRHDADGWHTLMCGGAQFKSAQALRQAGVNDEEAQQLSKELARHEKSLSDVQLTQINSFEGIVSVLTHPEHHKHH
jgi:hypothetical protein